MSEPADAPPEQNAFEAGRAAIKADIEKWIRQNSVAPPPLSDWGRGWNDACRNVLELIDQL